MVPFPKNCCYYNMFCLVDQRTRRDLGSRIFNTKADKNKNQWSLMTRNEVKKIKLQAKTEIPTVTG